MIQCRSKALVNLPGFALLGFAVLAWGALPGSGWAADPKAPSSSASPDAEKGVPVNADVKVAPVRYLAKGSADDTSDKRVRDGDKASRSGQAEAKVTGGRASDVSVAEAKFPSAQGPTSAPLGEKQGAEAATKREKESAKPGEDGKASIPTRGPDYPSMSVWPWGDPFEVTTSDGMMLRGFYKPPREPRTTVLVFLTGGRTDIVTAFRPLVLRLAAKGYGIAALDARGVGLSMKKTDGTTYDLKPDSSKPEPYKQMIDDVKVVVEALRQEKGVRPFRMVLVGSSIGGNVAIMAAAELPLEIRSVVTISAGMNYRGLEPLSAAQNLGGRALLALAAGSDSYAYTLIQRLKHTAPNSTTFILGGGAHGHALLDTEVVERIAVWLDEH